MTERRSHAAPGARLLMGGLAAGAGLAMVLDRHAPDWRDIYLERKFALEVLLP